MSDTIIVALIVGIFGLLTAGIGLAGVWIARQTHTLINSRMDEMLTLTRAESRAEGVAAGEQAQRDRTADAQQPADQR